MALSTIVKINSVTNLSDARYAAGMGVQMMGFSLREGDPRQVSHSQYMEINGWISGVETVVEIGMADVPFISEIREKYSPDRFQTSDWDTLARLRSMQVSCIWEIRETEIEEAIQHLGQQESHRPDYVLVAGDLDKLPKEIAQGLKRLSKMAAVLLGTGIESRSVHAVLEETGALGIAITGGEEIRPGLKDFDEMADILECLEVED